MGAEESVDIEQGYAGDQVRASWPFSLHTLRQNMAYCKEDGREALIGAFLWCTDKAHPVHMAEFSDRVGFAKNTVYKLMSGKYSNPSGDGLLDVPEKLTRNVQSFLALERERFLGGRTEFVVTPTAKRIWRGCALGRESESPVLMWGVSQIGKTWALERYAQDNNHGRSVYCRMKAASGLGGMVRRLAEKLAISPNGNTANLTDYIKHALTKDMLLILDEVHLLMYTYRKASFFACMEVLREIYDESGCGMVLCGTRLLQEKLDCRELVQLMRRGVHRVNLPDAPTRGDVEAIVEASGLDWPARGAVVKVQDVEERPYEVLRQLARSSGLKAVTERLRYARKLSARAHRAVRWEDFVTAHLSVEAEARENAKDEWN